MKAVARGLLRGHPTLMRWAFSAAAVACFAPGLEGCVQRPAAKVQRDIQTVQDETTVEKLVERGRAFASVGDFTRAEQYLAAALERGAESSKVLPLLLRACVSEGRYRVAIDYAEPQLKMHPDDYRLRFVLASLYATIGETKSAREQLELVARQKPDDAEAHYALARLLRDDENDPAGADTHFREYLRIRPTGPHADEARAGLLKRVP